MSITLGSTAPDFVQESTEGTIKFHEWIGDKWAILVLSAIAHGAHRNGELLRRVGGISQKALTRTLRDLETNGLSAA